MVVDSGFRKQLEGFGTSLVEVHYYMPDHPSLLQMLAFQQQDVAPEFPALRHFLDHWRSEIEAVLHSVRFCHQRLIGPGEWRSITSEWLIN